MEHLYEDGKGIIHSCEQTEAHPGIILVWTKCDIDVPPNKSFKSNSETFNCVACGADSK